MGKTPKVKKRGVSIHSRAARRQGSPGINADKSLLTATTPTEEKETKSKFLGVQDGGISKKKRAKPMMRQQRLRHQKGIEHAERNIDKLERKLATSKDRAKNIKSRAAPWEELNEQVIEKPAQSIAKQPKRLDLEEGADETTQDDTNIVPNEVLPATITSDRAADVPLPQDEDVDEVL